MPTIPHLKSPSGPEPDLGTAVTVSHGADLLLLYPRCVHCQEKKKIIIIMENKQTGPAANTSPNKPASHCPLWLRGLGARGRWPGNAQTAPWAQHRAEPTPSAGAAFLLLCGLPSFSIFSSFSIISLPVTFFCAFLPFCSLFSSRILDEIKSLNVEEVPQSTSHPGYRKAVHDRSQPCYRLA